METPPEFSDIYTSCCFTGHRSMGEEDISPVVHNISAEILRLHKLGVNRFFTGGALGFDMAAAITVINLRYEHPALSLFLALPCRDHMLRWEQKQKIRFGTVMDRADGVILVTDTTYENGCMMRRNRYMVDRAAYCIAWYDGRPGGGTRYTMKYAAARGRTVINVYGR
ncbi:MAG: SLOG family protein [Eubacteriales bacterium]|jgi:uncharacterized phage-like protein YoqJ|nr:SLOG family protein [Eubacteriales bacterium]